MRSGLNAPFLLIESMKLFNLKLCSKGIRDRSKIIYSIAVLGAFTLDIKYKEVYILLTIIE